MNRSTSEVMRNSRPIKMDENMRNIKVEGDNSFSFVSTFFSVLGRIMINKAAFNILEYCDGDNSVQDICHLLNTKYDIDEDIIYKDVDKTLQLFWRLKVIKMTCRLSATSPYRNRLTISLLPIPASIHALK